MLNLFEFAALLTVEFLLGGSLDSGNGGLRLVYDFVLERIGLVGKVVGAALLARAVVVLLVLADRVRTVHVLLLVPNSVETPAELSRFLLS